MKKQMDSRIIKRLRELFSTGKFDYIADAKIDSSLEKVFLYPTDDFFLTKMQFDAISSLVGEHENLYVMEMGWKTSLGLFDTSNVYYQLSGSSSYEKYSQLDLSTITLLFSDSFRWAVLCDELRDFGYGILFGDAGSIRDFSIAYGSTQKDILRYLEFCKLEQDVRNMSFSNLLHVFDAFKTI